MGLRDEDGSGGEETRNVHSPRISKFHEEVQTF